MSSLAFATKDLLRRKLQTSLTIVTLTLSVASTLFLLLFSERIGFGITSTVNTLTAGLSNVLAQFVLFVGILIFAVGAVITSFIVFLMMKQRMRDFGLIKAAGCPNGLVFGYFITELLTVTLIGCVLGVVFGFAADFAVTNFLGFQSSQTPPYLWPAPLVFAVFFVLAVTFGTKPMLDAARASPVRLLSPVQYFGLGTGGKLKPLSRFGLTLRIASRSLFRRQSASVRIIVLLSVVFVLLTVSIAGGIIASDTTGSWVENAVGKNIIAVAHSSMGAQYESLLSTFYGAKANSNFDYLDPKLAVSEAILEQVNETLGISPVDARLVVMESVREMSGYKIDPDTQSTIPVGDNRTGESLVVGVEPEKILTGDVTNGYFLNSSDAQEAVIGDTLAQAMYSPDLSRKPPITVSDPFLQNLIIRDRIFKITGVCVDPINNGNVTYVSLKNLQNVTGFSGVNIVFFKLDSSVDRSAVLAQLQENIQNINPDFRVFELDEVGQKDVAFLGSLWSSIMFLPLFALSSAAFCLVGYVLLGMDEQSQEFAVLRAVGVKAKTIITVIAIQNLTVIASSFAVGISFGVITTLIILMPHPLVTTLTIVEIAAWLISALAGMFLLSLYPAVRLAKTPILKIMT